MHEELSQERAKAVSVPIPGVVEQEKSRAMPVPIPLPMGGSHKGSEDDEKYQLLQQEHARLQKELEKERSKAIAIAAVPDMSDHKEKYERLQKENERLQEELEVERSKDALVPDMSEHEEKYKFLQKEYDELQRELEQQLLITTQVRAKASAAALSGSENDEKYNLLQEDYTRLQEELQQQQLITNQVRAEASAFLEEMRTLAEHDGAWTSEQQAEEIDTLKKEVEEWRSRYAKSRAQVKNLRASTYGMNSAFNMPHDNTSEKMFQSPNGMVVDLSVSKFQIAIDEFVLQSRTSASKDLLDILHGVVIATRHITQDISNCSLDDMKLLNPDVDEFQNQLAQATSFVSATANHLITTTRNHSTSGGLSPIFLLDAAVSDLSAAVIDLVKIARIRPSPRSLENRESVDMSRGMTNGTVNGSSHAEPEPRMNGDGADSRAEYRRVESPTKLRNMSQSMRQSQYESQSNSQPQYRHEPQSTTLQPQSKYESYHQPQPSQSSTEYSLNLATPVTLHKDEHVNGDAHPKFDTANPADNTVTELQEYLENQTVGVIDSIQELLTGIKGSANYKVLRRDITTITDRVRVMLAATSSMMQQSKHWQLKEHGAYIVDNLENCCQRMKMLYGDSAIHDESSVPDKNFKQRLAGISFDMAKCTTQLVKTVEEVSLKQEITNIDQELEDRR